MDDFDVFLNYRSSNARDFASHLYVALKSAGLSPFMDRRSLVKGADADPGQVKEWQDALGKLANISGSQLCDHKG